MNHDHHLSQSLIDGYVLQTLSDAERETIDMHLTTCPICRARLERAQTLEQMIVQQWQGESQARLARSKISFTDIAPRLASQRPQARRRPLELGAALLAGSVLALFLFVVYTIFRPELISQEMSPAPPPGLFADQWQDRAVYAGTLSNAGRTAAERLDSAPVYHLDLQIEDGLTVLSARQEVHYTNRTGQTLDMLPFYLVANRAGGRVEVDQAWLNGRPVLPRYEQQGSVLLVPLTGGLANGQSVVVGLEYRLWPSPQVDGDGNLGSNAFLSLAHFYPQLIPWDGRSDAGALPVYGEPLYAESAFYRVRVTAPATLTVVASGSRVQDGGERPPDGRQRLEFAAGPARHFYLAVSEQLLMAQDRLGQLQLNAYYLPGGEAGAQVALIAAKESFNSFNQRFGLYPYAEYDLVALPAAALPAAVEGMAFAGVGGIREVFFDITRFDQASGLDGPTALQRVVAHQVARQYFGQVVGNHPGREPWLSATLAEYLTSLYYAPHYDQLIAEQTRQRWREQLAAAPAPHPPVGLALSAVDGATYKTALYLRGPLFLDALKDIMGEASFAGFLRSYYLAHQWQISDTEIFRQQAEAAALVTWPRSLPSGWRTSRILSRRPIPLSSLDSRREKMKLKSVLTVLMLAAVFLVNCNPTPAEPENQVMETAEMLMPTPEPATATPEPLPTATIVPTPIPTEVNPIETATAEPELLTLQAEPQGIAFHLVGEEGRGSPILPPAEGARNTIYTDPGAVVYHDGLFHMFYNSFNGWPARVMIAYATSPDGITWTRASEEGVFSAEQTDFNVFTLLASSALVEADGTWVLYFYTWDQQTNNARGSIGRATAPAPTGPWTADPDYLLTADSGRWDSLAVRSPHVIRTDGGYFMYYTGAGPAVTELSIGLATSEDGLSWSKYDDPGTTASPYDKSDPILTPGESGSWDSRRVEHARVHQTPTGWVMFYRATSTGPGVSGVGYATSEDGIHWTKEQDQPVIGAADVVAWGAIWFINSAYQDGIFYLFLEAGIGNRTDVHVATYEGSLTADG